MSSFLDKFKKKETNDAPPQGVNVEHSSFAYEKNENSYKPTTVPEPNSMIIPFQKKIVQTKATVPPNRSKGRPGGGWEDDSEDEAPKVTASKQQQHVTPTVNQPIPPVETKTVVEPPKKVYEQVQLSRLQNFTAYQFLSPEELQAGNYEYEQNQVTEATKLGGMRLKQSDLVLKDFGTAAENLQEQVIGSMLLIALHNEENWKVQLRVAYAIEHLILTITKYKKYFEANIKILNLATNQAQLSQTLESIKGELQGRAAKQQQVVSNPQRFFQEVSFEFIEPPKPIEPVAPQPQVKQPQVDNILDIDAQPTQKRNAFGFLNKKPTTNENTDLISNIPPTQSNLLDDAPLVNNTTPIDTQPKKANAFGFIKKTEAVQPPEEPKKEKPNSFNFLNKNKQEPNLLSQSPPQTQLQPPQQAQFQSQSLLQPQTQPQMQPQTQSQMPPQMQPNFQPQLQQPYQQYPYPNTGNVGQQYMQPNNQYQPPPGYPLQQFYSPPVTGYPYPYTPPPQYQQLPPQQHQQYPPYPYSQQQQYPPYGYQGNQYAPNQTPPQNFLGNPSIRADDKQISQEKKPNKDESAFDFIKI